MEDDSLPTASLPPAYPVPESAEGDYELVEKCRRKKENDKDTCAAEENTEEKQKYLHTSK